MSSWRSHWSSGLVPSASSEHCHVCLLPNLSIPDDSCGGNVCDHMYGTCAPFRWSPGRSRLQRHVCCLVSWEHVFHGSCHAEGDWLFVLIGPICSTTPLALYSVARTSVGFAGARNLSLWVNHTKKKSSVGLWPTCIIVFGASAHI